MWRTGIRLPRLARLAATPYLPDGYARNPTSRDLSQGASKHSFLRHAYRSVPKALTRLRDRYMMIMISKRMGKIKGIEGFRGGR